MLRRNICSPRMKRIYFIAFLCIGINLIIFNFLIYRSQIKLLNKDWVKYFTKNTEEVVEKNFIGKKISNKELGGLNPPKPLVPSSASEISVTEVQFGVEHTVEGPLRVDDNLGVKQTTEASTGMKQTTKAALGMKQTMKISLRMKQTTNGTLPVKPTTEAYFEAQTTKATFGVKQAMGISSGIERTTGTLLGVQPTTVTFLRVKNSTAMSESTEVSIEKTVGDSIKTKLPKKTENTALEVWHEHKSIPVLIEPDIFSKAAIEMIAQGQNLKFCPVYPLGSVGIVNVSVVNATEVGNINERVFWSQSGGHYAPPCLPKQSLALIIPLKNSTKVLPTFLINVHVFLRAQLLNYTIFVVQQEGPVFNKGQLMNAAYLEALKIHNFTCFIFHNPEKVPKSCKNMYQCSKSVRFLSEGVFAVHRDVFRRINGFSNKIWGENGGDYDLKFRLDRYEIRATKPRKDLGEYELLTNIKERYPGEERRDAGYDYGDGLSNLKVKVKSVEKLPLFTKILVEMNNVTKSNTNGFAG